MLSYRHLYHAGNFADVFKHVLLTRLLLALNAKDKPYCYLDTHAGLGVYDLAHPWAFKAREYENGISRLWERSDIPELLQPWLAAVKSENPSGRLRFYPGSPLIAKQLMRSSDRMVLTELNKTDFDILRGVFHDQKRVSVQCMDAYQGLKAYLPPPERRGLVLIDSGFDRSREFDRILKALKEAHARWATGIYAIWYPVMEPAPMRDFYGSLERSGIRKVLKLEFAIRKPEDAEFMSACGLVVVNPPWHFDDEAKAIVAYLAKTLGQDGQGRGEVRWLVPE